MSDQGKRPKINVHVDVTRESVRAQLGPLREDIATILEDHDEPVEALLDLIAGFIVDYTHEIAVHSVEQFVLGGLDAHIKLPPEGGLHEGD